MEMPPLLSPAKRQHYQISPLSAASTCDSVDGQPPRQQHNPLESFIQFFGSTFRSSSIQTSNDKQRLQAQASQQYRPPAQSVALRPSIRSSSDTMVHSPSSNNNIKHQFGQQQETCASSMMTEYDAMLAGSHNARLTSTASSSESYIKSSATYATATSPSSISAYSSAVVTFSESATSSSSAWRVAICPRTNQPYYWNVQTRESRWKKPLELATAEEVESIRNKERKQREFFECMERNILRRLEQGGDGGYSNNIVTVGTNPTPNSNKIDQYPMQPTSAATTAASVSPTESNDGNNSNMNDWIAEWITPSSETDCGVSPSGSLSSIETLSEFGSFDKCCSVKNNNHGNNVSSPYSLDESLDWSHLGSMESSDSREEEHIDEVHPLPIAGKPSKLERIKSSSSKPVIDKPNLIRTISKMEHDMFVARQLNPNLRINVNKINNTSVSTNEWYCLDSPRTVSGTEETKKKLKRNNDITHEPLSPTTETCDILSSLHLTHDNEGLNISLDTSVESTFCVPTSPLTPNDTDDDDADATPSKVRSMGSPGSRTVSTADASNTINATITKPSLTKRNTCGTIYLGSTLSAPDKEALIKCVCGVFRAHLLQGKSADVLSPSNTNNEYDIFRDRRSAGDYRFLDITSIPSLSTITDYFRSIFLRSQMEVECIIVSLIYIERVIKLTDGKLAPKPSNWRSVLFSCMVLASKVWDDLSMWNCDFSKIVPSGVTFSLTRTNQLEIALLRALRYKVKVNASEYAKYYFLLRGMLCKSGLANDDLTRLEALDVKGALNLLDAVNGGVAGASSRSNGGGERSVGSSVAKVLIQKRCKSSGVVERSSMTKAVGEDDGSCDSGLKSPQCNISSATKVSLEQIVRMN